MTKANFQISETITPGDVIALGDVHASWDLYSQFLAWIKDSQATVILLGDMIDRGGDDLPVLNATAKLLDDPESWGLQSFYALMGNHEQLFLNAVDNHGDLYLWIQNGANVKDAPEMQEHRDWISQLPIYMTIGDTLFIHGGLVPGQDPAETIRKKKGAESLVWMRNPFLSNGPKFEKWNNNLKKVVHGHTITMYESQRKSDKPVPVIKKDRVNIDTGAFLSKGRLTAYNVTQDTFYQFSRN